MKPSERLREIAEYCDRHYPSNGSAANAIKAITTYLDEQHERERRRIAVWTALAMVGPGCTNVSMDRQLERAGLGLRARDFHYMTFGNVRDMIVEAAELEGLL